MKMENMIVLNTVAELREFLDNTGLDTLVGRVAFACNLKNRWYNTDIRSKTEKEMKMQTMMIAVGGVYADYHMIGKEIKIVRVYRNGYTFTDTDMIEHAKFTIQAVKDGWMTIGKKN